jgi:hypothetical protein
MSVMSNHEALESLYSVDADQIEKLPWKPVPRCPGVHEKTLWRFGDIVEALIHLQPDATTPGVPHLAAHHHLWVVSGAARVAGRRLAAGSYCMCRPGLPTPSTAWAPKGARSCRCTVRMPRPRQPRCSQTRPRKRR